MSINGGTPVPTFNTLIRNTDPGSNAGIPGLSLYAGITRGGLPVGLEIDGRIGSDAKLLGLGLSIESVLGSAPAPKQ
jgi:mandelamide amidase